MKKYILLVVSAIAFAFTSCSDKDEIEIKYQVDITIDPSTVTSSFHGYLLNGETYGLDMAEDTKLRITSLIYDANGNLVDKKESLVKDYSSNAKYSLTMEEKEKYTIIAITSAVTNEGYESYIIDNEETINKLTVTANESNGYSYYSNFTILGVAKTEITSKEENVKINVVPASALVVLTYYDIHALDDAGIDTHWVAYKNNDMAIFENSSLSFTSSAAVNSGFVHSLDVTEQGDYSGIFVMLNLLPTSGMKIWGGFDMGEKSASYYSFLQYAGLDPTVSETITNIEAGKEYYIDVDCGNLTVKAGTLSRSAESKGAMQINRKVFKSQNITTDAKTIAPQIPTAVLDIIKNIK